MNRLILFLAFGVSITVKAQTFIGKTEKEIQDFAGKNSYVLESASAETIQNLSFHSVMYGDASLPAHYVYEFNADNICISYIIWTNDQPTKEVIRKNIEKLCPEKPVNGMWVQKADGKAYTWNYQGFESSFAFISTELKQ